MLLLITWLSMLLVISLIPLPDVRITPQWHLDKVVHFLLYGITGILFYRGLRFRLKWFHIFSSVGLSALYGLFLEILQHLTSYRSFSLSDIMANIFGAIIFVLVAYKQESLD